jgi:diaminopimelate epimerase
MVKAQALGNDFLLVAAEALPPGIDRPDLARRACHRHHGIGADGLMVVEATPEGARTRLLNADGSRSEVSGNGVRCVAAWLAAERGLTPGDSVIIDTEAGPKALALLEARDGRFTFRAAMGPPEQLRQETIDVAGALVECVVLRVGNPQCVVLGDVTPERLQTVAGPLAVHPFFPEGTNVELATVEAPDCVRILIWERGVGPTEASGTGACAAGVAAAAYGGAGREVDVVAPGGTQRVEWTDEGIWLTGWAEPVATIRFRA